MDLVARARAMIERPRLEWPVIAAEPRDIGALFTGYACIVAAVPALASAAHRLLIGGPFVSALLLAVVQYVMAVVGVFVLGLVASKLAPVFGGVEDLPQGMKLAVYAYTAAWLGGIFVLLPYIGIILQLICAIYSLYVFYLGITELVRVPPQRRGGFMVAIVLVAIAVTIVLGLLVGLLLAPAAA